MFSLEERIEKKRGDLRKVQTKIMEAQRERLKDLEKYADDPEKLAEKMRKNEEKVAKKLETLKNPVLTRSEALSVR